MRIRIVILWIVILCSHTLSAQYAYFPQGGTIHFEKTVHVKNFLKTLTSVGKNDNFDKTYMEQMMSKAPETYIFKSKLLFSDEKSRYEPVKQELTGFMRSLIWFGLDYEGIFYQDMKKKQMHSLMDYQGTNMWTQDSLLNVKWKITDEYREIAGYSCRRANGVIMDSVYVVAFYTDDIPLSSGPSTFHGLPGMILGAVIPDRHTSIYATKVEIGQPEVTQVVGKKRDKPMTRKEIQSFLRESMSVGEWTTEKQFKIQMLGLFL
ncbi:GLPGLI family protein [Sphingobacterium psychroaquaticum]|uniref:GLPGLI family protein n=1 Tax=Sphingobacterium psychroaquaticum TaxID=561061 RepID=UPI00106A3EF5|nr:GLPGLI family protein [Sphingobacterium psychroaquaticum]QBQ42383.1 GLPGLI family protein [Sphingobacterium psychroaquaticum]